jgi:hypothetical protein
MRDQVTAGRAVVDVLRAEGVRFDTDAQERVYAEIYRAAVDWDGHDPIRKDMP